MASARYALLVIRPKRAPSLGSQFTLVLLLVTSLIWLINPNADLWLKWVWGTIGGISLIGLIWFVLKRRKLKRARTSSNPPQTPQ